MNFPRMMENTTSVNVYVWYDTCTRDMWVEWLIDRNFISRHFLLHQSGFQVSRNANFTILIIIMFLRPIDYVMFIRISDDKQNI